MSEQQVTQTGACRRPRASARRAGPAACALAGLIAMLAIPVAIAQLPDPTAPLNRSGVSAGGEARPSWQLQSTLVGRERRIAIINDTIVSVGDRIGGARVVAIEPQQVLLDIDGRRLRLALFGADAAATADPVSEGAP